MNRLAGSRSGRWATAIWGGFACGAGACASVLVPPVAVGALLVGAGVLLGAAALVGRGRLTLPGLVLLAVFVGSLRGATAIERPSPGRIDGHLGWGPVAILGTVREAVSVPGSAVTIDVRRLSDADTDATIGGGLLVSGPNVPVLAPGDEVEIDAGGLRPPDRRPGPESEATLERKGVEAVAVAPLVSIRQHGGVSPAGVVAWAQARLVRTVDAVLPEPQAALVLGVAFGIHQPIAGEIRTPLQDAGLIHIVVVSGLKVVMVLGLIAAVGSGLGWSARRRLVAAIPIVAAYVLLSGAGPAAIRSALMAGAAMLARSGGRRTDPLPMLSLVAAGMLGIDPALVRDPGFQLSFLGTAGIVLLARPLARRLPGPRVLVEPFAVTVAAQAATVPVMAGTFGVVSLVGPVANAAVLPLLPMLIVLGGAGAVVGTVLPALGWPLVQLGGLGALVVILVGRALTSLPGAFVQVGTWPGAWTVAEVCGLLAAGAVGAVAWSRAQGSTPSLAVAEPRPRHTRIALAAAAAAIVSAGAAGFAASRPDGLLHVTVLSTGDAPAVLVRADDGALALIDGGRSPSLLLQALGRVLSPADHRLDMVVVTGGDQNAIAGLSALPGHYAIGTVVAPPDMNPGGANVVAALQTAGAAMVDPAGRSWEWGGAIWRCLGFLSEATGRSMCAVSVIDRSGRLLVLGDAGSADQEQLCAMYGGGLRNDLLVTEPGGALSTALVAVARPRVVAVPTAQGGHTAAAPDGYTVTRTAVDGDLRFSGSRRGLIEDA